MTGETKFCETGHFAEGNGYKESGEKERKRNIDLNDG